jgi:hypothetical protein
MPSIVQAIQNNQKRLNAGGPAASATETEQILKSQLAISPAPSPPLDLPVGFPQRGVFPANLVLASDRSDNSREYRGPGARSSTFPFPNIPVSNQTQATPSTVTPAPTPAPTPTPSNVGAPGSLSMPSIFSVGPSAVPVTAFPDGNPIPVTLVAQSANTGFFGPASGSADVPAFRSMVVADEPSTTVNFITNDTNVTGVILNQVLTLGWTGTLAVARGGTGTSTPALVQGSNIAITGTWPNQTIALVTSPVISGNLTLNTGLLDSTGSAGSAGYVLQSTGSATLWVPSTYAKVNLTGQTTSISSTTLYAVPSGAAGLYRVSYSLIDTSVGAAGTLTATISWNNGTGTPSQTTSSLNLTSLGAEVSGNFTFYSAASQNISYSTTATSVVGSPTYSLYLRVEYLG